MVEKQVSKSHDSFPLSLKKKSCFSARAAQIHYCLFYFFKKIILSQFQSTKLITYMLSILVNQLCRDFVVSETRRHNNICVCLADNKCLELIKCLESILKKKEKPDSTIQNAFSRLAICLFYSVSPPLDRHMTDI